MTPDTPTGGHAPVDISVVVPYYDDQRGLDLLLAALELQATSAAFEVIVADDGSPVQPRTGDRPFPTRTVRQEDTGFRAAAARNLGASVARGSILVFLDGDMVPEPGYLAAVEAALAGDGEDTLVVGRRRHADLAGWDPGGVTAWLAGATPGPPELEEPQWLLDGYRGTDNLRSADDRSYRFVISAVLSAPRERFQELGGFVEFSGYGGEDWEFAHRWRHHGGAFRHVPEAVAWQDGADFSTRHDPAERRRIKDAETLRLAPLLPVEGTRDARLVWRVPRVAVLADATGLTAAQAVEFLASLVHGSDAAVWVQGMPEALHQELQDPRIRRPGDGDPGRSSFVVEVHRPGVLTGPTLTAIVERGRASSDDAPASPAGTSLQAGAEPTLTIRHVPTGSRWDVVLAPDEWQDLPPEATTLEQHWARGL